MYAIRSYYVVSSVLSIRFFNITVATPTNDNVVAIPSPNATVATTPAHNTSFAMAYNNINIAPEHGIEPTITAIKPCPL